MSIKKFYSIADNTITNAYKADLSTRATDSNMGLSDSLEVFFIFGQNPDQNAELIQKLEESRIVIKFDIDQIRQAYENQFPEDTKFVLKLFNAEHPYTLARNYKIKIYSLSESFIEGNGLDMESYLDEGASSWLKRDIVNSWQTPGGLNYEENGDILNSLISEQQFDTGEENLEVNITNYIKGYFDDLALIHQGFIIVIDESLTSGFNIQNYYTKKFFSRSSEFFFKRPTIEVRTSSSDADDRGNFYTKSQVLTEAQNTQRIYLYNSVSGDLSDFQTPQDNEIYVKIYTDSEKTTLANLNNNIEFVGATKKSKGVYFVDLIVDNSNLEKIYEEWFVAPEGDSDDQNKIILHEGEINLKKFKPMSSMESMNYVSNITNLKSSYSSSEAAKFRVYTRTKDWSPTIYTVASKKNEPLIVEKIYYKIVRIIDDEDVIPYGIGTSGANNDHTLLSYDIDGSYFNLDMSLLESGYMYGVKLLYSINGEYKEQDSIFKFRVD